MRSVVRAHSAESTLIALFSQTLLLNNPPVILHKHCCIQSRNYPHLQVEKHSHLAPPRPLLEAVTDLLWGLTDGQILLDVAAVPLVHLHDHAHGKILRQRVLRAPPCLLHRSSPAQEIRACAAFRHVSYRYSVGLPGVHLTRRGVTNESRKKVANRQPDTLSRLSHKREEGQGRECPRTRAGDEAQGVIARLSVLPEMYVGMVEHVRVQPQVVEALQGHEHMSDCSDP